MPHKHAAEIAKNKAMDPGSVVRQSELSRAPKKGTKKSSTRRRRRAVTAGSRRY